MVLDNAFGSGSFLIAAIKERRNFIGIEKNINTELFKNKKIDYIKLAHERIIETYNNMGLYPYSYFKNNSLKHDYEKKKEFAVCQ